MKTNKKGQFFYNMIVLFCFLVFYSQMTKVHVPATFGIAGLHCHLQKKIEKYVECVNMHAL